MLMRELWWVAERCTHVLELRTQHGGRAAEGFATAKPKQTQAGNFKKEITRMDGAWGNNNNDFFP